jgi:uncharacterized membrane protein YedE/YeeE
LTEFTPVSAAIGGALIGLSAVLLMALNGRIAGISGTFSGAFFSGAGDRAWKIMFLAGLIAAPGLQRLVTGAWPPFDMAAGWPLIVVGGLLVGFGTRLGSGCTSGHGVCGLSRLSPRSMVAVGAFMSAGFVTVAVVRSVMGA